MACPGRSALCLETVETPAPGVGQVCVKVSAVALNRRDLAVIDRGMGVGAFPFTPLSDMAGVVTRLGEGARRFRVGDRVISVFLPEWIDGAPPGSARRPSHLPLGGAHDGVLAEQVALPEDWLVAAPETLTDVEACTLPVSGLTAWTALVQDGGLRAGQTILVHGTGGVALQGVGIALAIGARVIVSSGDPVKAWRLKALGDVEVVDRRHRDWAEVVLAVTGERGVDHTLETVGGANLNRSIAVSAPGARIALIGVLDGADIQTTAGPWMMKGLSIQGVQVGSRTGLEAMVTEVDRLRLKPVIDTVYPLDAFPEALNHLERGAFGKIVITTRGDLHHLQHSTPSN